MGTIIPFRCFGCPRFHRKRCNKSNVIGEIYYADFRYEYDKQMKLYGCRIELASFNDKIEREYIFKYWSMFN